MGRAESKPSGRQKPRLLGENMAGGKLVFQEALKCASIYEPTCGT